MSKKIIGIDLGTANSCVSVIQDGKPIVLSDEEGRPTTPSIYAIDGAENHLIGYPAKEQMHQNRLNTIYAVKRLIGLKYDTEEVADIKNKTPYEILPAQNNDAWVEINGTPTSPEAVSAKVLERMKDIAEHQLGEKVHRAVITVPAHFNDAQRQATKDAGKIAGLDVLRIINEPTAAALAYGLDIVKDESRKVAGKSATAAQADKIVCVFDLGGGTFDVSILALRDGVFDVLSTQGDTFLGGEDFDLAIMNYLLEEAKTRHGVDISNDKAALQRLKVAAKEAKHDLSHNVKTLVEIPFLSAGSQDLAIEIERKMLEKIVRPVLDRVQGPCLAALEDAGLRPQDVDDTILVGGMTKMPAVKKFCKNIFGKEPIDSVNPDEAVALGAAIQGGLLEGLVQGVSLLDVTSLSLGLEVQGGMCYPLIPRNTKVPCKVTEVFTTSAPNQEQVSIHIVQGESTFAPENKSLGRFELMNIPAAPRGVPDIEVTFEVDCEGIVHVKAKDLQTGEERNIEIIASSGLSEDEIDQLMRETRIRGQQQERMEARINGGQSKDELLDELSQAKHDLKTAIYITQFKLDTEGEFFRGEARKTLEDCLNQSRTILNSAGDVKKIENSLMALQTVCAVFERHLEIAA